MNAKKLVSLLLASAMLLTLFTGCKKTEQPSGNNDPVQPGTSKDPGNAKVRTDIVVAWKIDLVNTDPQKMNDSASQRVIRMLYDRLVHIDENEKPIPGLAEKWEIVSDTEYKFYIRKGVKFHNGEELKAEDVKFSLDRARESSYTKAFAGAISQVDIIDDYTVLVKTETPYAPLLTNLSLEHCSIVNKKAIEELGDSYKDNPVGTGPMKFKSWHANNEFIAVRNEEYWGEKAKATSVTVKIIPEDASRTIALENGEIDINLDVPLVDLARMEQNSKLEVHEQEGVAPTYLCFNQEKELTKNLKVRQAISYAIDRQAIVDVVFEGYGDVANNVIPPAMGDFFNDKIGVYDYNKEEAKKCLVEAGYPNGFKIELSVGTEERNRIAQLVQANCADVGIEVDIAMMEWGVFLEYVAKPEYDMMILGVSNRRDPEATFGPNFHSRNIGAAGNRARYNSPETDKLIDDAKAEMDYNKRVQLYHQIQDKLYEDCVWQPLATKKNYVAMVKGVTGINYSAIESHDVHNATVTIQ